MNRKRAKFWGKNERELNVRTKKKKKKNECEKKKT